MGTSMDRSPTSGSFCTSTSYWPELDLDALQGDRLRNWKICTPCWPRPRPAPTRWKKKSPVRPRSCRKSRPRPLNRARRCWPAPLPTAANRPSGRSIWMRAAAFAGRAERPLCRAKNAEAEARRAYLSAHGAASASAAAGRALDALTEELSRRKTALDTRRTQSRKGRKCPCPHPEPAGCAAPACALCCRHQGRRADGGPLPQLTAWLSAQEKPLEEAYFKHPPRLLPQLCRRSRPATRCGAGCGVRRQIGSTPGDAATRVRDAVNAELRAGACSRMRKFSVMNC